MNTKLVRQLEEAANVGLDLSPGDPLAARAFTALQEAQSIAEEFIRRRDAGELRSNYTYARMKKFLEILEK